MHLTYKMCQRKSGRVKQALGFLSIDSVENFSFMLRMVVNLIISIVILPDCYFLTTFISTGCISHFA
jgi:hypothetical protein